MAKEKITRRGFLVRALGGVIAAVGGYFAGKYEWLRRRGQSVVRPTTKGPGPFFTAHEFRTLSRLTALIVPDETGSPGAAELNAAATIERRIVDHKSMERRYRQGLRWLDQASARTFGSKRRFLDLSEAQQQLLLEQANAELARRLDPAVSVMERAWRKWDILYNDLFGLGSGVTFFALVRDDTFEAVYGDPRSWAALGYDGPPQPRGYWDGFHGQWNIIDDCPPVKRVDFPYRPEKG